MILNDADIDKRDRSPKFPYINLGVSLERAERLHSSSRGNAVRLSDAAVDWNLSPTSSSTLRTASALLAFGLIEDQGSGPDRRIKLTETALRIISDKRPGVREQLIAKCALLPPIISEYYSKWGFHRPTDSHATSELKFESGFTERAARTFLNVFDETIKYVSKESSQVDPNEEEGPTSSELPFSEQSDASHEVIGGESQSEGVSNQIRPDAKQALECEVELLRARVSKNVTVRVLASGELNERMIGRLIALLEAQRQMIEED